MKAKIQRRDAETQREIKHPIRDDILGERKRLLICGEAPQSILVNLRDCGKTYRWLRDIAPKYRPLRFPDSFKEFIEEIRNGSVMIFGMRVMLDETISTPIAKSVEVDFEI